LEIRFLEKTTEIDKSKDYECFEVFDGFAAIYDLAVI
jgi:hypothetical protein